MFEFLVNCLALLFLMEVKAINRKQNNINKQKINMKSTKKITAIAMALGFAILANTTFAQNKNLGEKQFNFSSVLQNGEKVLISLYDVPDTSSLSNIQSEARAIPDVIVPAEGEVAVLVKDHLEKEEFFNFGEVIFLPEKDLFPPQEFIITDSAKVDGVTSWKRSTVYYSESKNQVTRIIVTTNGLTKSLGIVHSAQYVLQSTKRLVVVVTKITTVPEKGGTLSAEKKDKA